MPRCAKEKMNNDMLIEPEIREFRIEECVRLEEICIPLSECVRIVPGQISN